MSKYDGGGALVGNACDGNFGSAAAGDINAGHGAAGWPEHTGNVEGGVTAYRGCPAASGIGCVNIFGIASELCANQHLGLYRHAGLSRNVTLVNSCCSVCGEVVGALS